MSNGVIWDNGAPFESWAQYRARWRQKNKRKANNRKAWEAWRQAQLALGLPWVPGTALEPRGGIVEKQVKDAVAAMVPDKAARKRLLAQADAVVKSRLDKGTQLAQLDEVSQSQRRATLLANFKEFSKSCKLLDKTGKLVPFHWNDPQLGMNKLLALQMQLHRPVLLVVGKARRWGCSINTTHFLAWQMLRKANTAVMVVLHDSRYLADFRQKYRQIFNGLPEWMRPEIAIDNANQIMLGNGSRVDFLSAGTKATADRVGRSTGYQWAHLTEVPFWFAPSQTMTSVRASVQLDGPHSGIIVESTPRGAHGTFYDMWTQAKSGQSDFVAYFVAWHACPEYTRPCTDQQMQAWCNYLDTKDSSKFKNCGWVEDVENRIGRFGLRAEQYNWWCWYFRNQCDSDLVRMKQEMGDDDMSCFLTSAKTAFEQGTLDALLGQCEAGKATPPSQCGLAFDSDGILRPDRSQRLYHVWQEPERSAQYVAVLDPAFGGQGADWSVLYIGRRYLDRLVVVAKLRSKNKPNVVILQAIALLRWFGAPPVCVEANKGEAHIHELRMQGYDNQWRRQRINVVDGKPLEDALGFYMDNRNRDVVLSTLSKYVSTGKVTAPDWDLYGEMLTFVQDENSGKRQAAPGCTDDHVIAAALLCYLDDITPLQGTDAPKMLQPEPTVQAFTAAAQAALATRMAENRTTRLQDYEKPSQARSYFDN